MAFFIYVILAAIGGIYQRQTSAFWNEMDDVRLGYNLLFGFGYVLFSLVSIIGLLLKREWGRIVAISFNWILFLTLCVPSIGVCFFAKYNDKSIIPVHIDAIIIGCLSLFFIIYLSRKSMRAIFKIDS